MNFKQNMKNTDVQKELGLQKQLIHVHKSGKKH